MNFSSKLECLSLATFSSLIECFGLRPVAYYGVEDHSGAPPRLALALIANIRLGWKSLPGTKTLDYYEL